MAGLIIDPGRGPELEGTRVSVHCVMDYGCAGDAPSQIAEDLDLSVEQVQAALEYVGATAKSLRPKRSDLEAGQSANPDWVKRFRESWTNSGVESRHDPAESRACS